MFFLRKTIFFLKNSLFFWNRRQTFCKSAGTTLATSLTCFWALGRLRCPARPPHSKRFKNTFWWWIWEMFFWEPNEVTKIGEQKVVAVIKNINHTWDIWNMYSLFFLVFACMWLYLFVINCKCVLLIFSLINWKCFFYINIFIK